MAELPGGPCCRSSLFPADREEPIKRKRPGAQIAPGHAMGKQVLGGGFGGIFYPLPCFLYYTTNCREILAAGKERFSSGAPAGGYRIPCEFKQEKFYSRKCLISLAPGDNFFESQFSKMAFSGMLLPPKRPEMAV